MVKLTWGQYTQMWDAALDFKAKNGRLPNYVDKFGYRFMKEAYQNAADNVVKFRDTNKRNPNTVEVTGTSLTKPSSNKSFFHQTVEAHVGFKYNNWNEFFMGMGGKGYKYYNNDVYPQGEALDRLQSNSGLNCADIGQIGHEVGEDLGEEMHYGHIKCKSGGGHIVLIKGPIKNAVKEGRVWDLAKKISKTSPFVAGANDYWCKDGTFISFDDPWLMSDDGRT